ncbi:MAG: glycosyltransferase family 9 protein, partial [Planctomycetes bacterium]|nr:glycosyltransferase family 9 protein [Planctomycetota bacterium]
MSRILVIRPGAIGDFIVTLPLLAALRKAHPDAHVEIMGYPHIAELAVGRHYADAVSRFDQPDMAPFFVQGGELPPSL